MKKGKYLHIILSATLIFLSYIGYSQVIPQGNDSIKILLKKENSFSVNIHTQGLGAGYRWGHHLTAYKKLMYDGEFVIMKHPKEIKSLYPIDQNSKSYFYGKLNNFYILRAGTGIQKVVNSKPYWGGVELRFFYFGGLSIGITKSVYLYIWNYSPADQTAVITIEKYDPSKHDIDNIYGRAPFTYGLGEIRFHPGIYGKIGFNFEFGQNDEKTRSLEIGLNVDAFPKAIPIMAFNNKNYVFTTVYLSYNFGKRKN